MAGQGNEDDALVEEEDAKELMFPKGKIIFVAILMYLHYFDRSSLQPTSLLVLRRVGPSYIVGLFIDNDGYPTS